MIFEVDVDFASGVVDDLRLNLVEELVGVALEKGKEGGEEGG